MGKKYQGLKIRHPEQNDELLKCKGVSLGAILDRYKPNVDGTFPVRIRIIHNLHYKQYATKISLTKEDFNKIAEGKKKNDENSIILLKKIKNVYDIILAMDEFSFDQFAFRFSGKQSDWNEVKCAFDTYIRNLRIEGKIGTANSYTDSLNSILKFSGNPKLLFSNISVDFLKKYQNYMLSL